MSRHVIGLSGQNQESGEKQEFREVTPELLAEILTSPKFLKQVREAWDLTTDEFEAGFTIGVNLQSGKIAHPKVFRSGEAENIKPLNPLDIRRSIDTTSIVKQSLHDRPETYPIFIAHTHPIRDSIGPSEGDLYTVFENRLELQKMAEADGHPIVLIITSPLGKMGRELNILLIQQRQNTPAKSGETGHGIYSTLQNITHGQYKRLDDPDEIASLFQKHVPLLNVALLKLMQKPSGVLVPLYTKKELATVLKDFDFRPRSI